MRAVPSTLHQLIKFPMPWGMKNQEDLHFNIWKNPKSKKWTTYPWWKETEPEISSSVPSSLKG